MAPATEELVSVLTALALPRDTPESSQNIDFNQYIKDSTATESPRRNLNTVDEHFRTLHAVLGISTEAGELLDMLKKTIFYGKEFDRTNLLEECGDLFWYVALLCDANDICLKSVLERNIAKLKARYPEKFTEQAAINRNLEKERAVLESK